MLRRKKILKLKKKQKELPNKDRIKHEEFMLRVKQRVENPAFKAEQRAEFLKSYAEKFSTRTYEPRTEWLDGKATKRCIMDPVDLKHVDTEDMNRRRKEAGIEIPVESAISLAREDAIAKSKRIGLAYSKGNYTYMGSDQDVKDMGKKTSQYETKNT